ncbi:hypothetical protein RDABS01_022144 [Bienertia sinuspersici]
MIKMGSQNNCVILLLLLTSTFIALVTPTIAQSTCRSHTFRGNRQYSSCNDLPELNSQLFWNYDSSAGTADIAFRVTSVSSSNWIAWALNPSGSGMVGAQALVAVQNSSGVHAYTSSVPGYSITTLTPGSLSFKVNNLTASKESNDMTIFATITPPSTTVNQVWQVGPMASGQPAAHPSNSGSANTKSTGSINFLSGQSSSQGPVVPRLKRKNTHGVLNAVSWGILMPLGAIIARYMKVFPSADPAWFYLHVICQFSAYVIGVAGWGTGLKLGSESVGIVYHVHRNIGIALFCLATLQVFALLLRPKKDHKYRLYWNLYHWSVGYAVIILGIINIYQGLDKVLQPEKKWKRIYSGIIIALGAIALVLEAFTWGVVMKRKKNDEKHGHPGNGTHGYSNGNGYTARTQPAV